jgi:predicted flap endonuclease-1-like 5' DNA nuclease
VAGAEVEAGQVAAELVAVVAVEAGPVVVAEVVDREATAVVTGASDQVAEAESGAVPGPPPEPPEVEAEPQVRVAEAGVGSSADEEAVASPAVPSLGEVGEPESTAGLEPAVAGAESPAERPEPPGRPVEQGSADVNGREPAAVRSEVDGGQPVNGAAPAPARDDLRRIAGVGPVTARALSAAGITTYREVAGLHDDDTALTRVRAELATLRGRGGSRIDPGRWAEQAKDLHLRKYGEQL